ncbi:hypothetical protein PMZ80_009443 [Knufia obscura]|uniref:Fibronectin type-III domain-containing protein n=1 Tax=Knufia obscura TaxID=1635080 RepID=A0ABR0RCX8_9EURO|nr:hypothetical protein PMZ80_009443 [Knufia obscura]
MPAIPLEWMDSAARQLDGLDPWTWAVHAHHLVAPRVNVNVLHTPNDVLVEKLGLDIPPEPTLTLEEIADRHVQISWKPEDSTTSIHEYHVELNGRTIGTTKKHETAAVISNLSPGTLYELRIFSISPGRFQTPSRALNIRTCKTSSTVPQDGSNDGTPVVKPLAPRLPSAPAVAPAPITRGDSTANPAPPRRGTSARKTPPAGQPEQTPESKDAEDDGGEDLAELSQQFSEINAEIDRIEADVQDEVQEFETAKKEKEAQRATFLQEVKERDEASNELKKQVHRAEAASRALLTEKTKKEKQLKDKENKRQKKINEMVQWGESVQTMAEEIDAIHKQKEALKRRMEAQVREVKEKIAEEQREIQQLEEENKEKASQLKELQEERKRNSVDEDTEESREADRRDQERDAQFRQDLASLSHRYNVVWQDLQRQHQDHVLARQRAAMMDTQRKTTAVSFAPIAPIDMDAVRGMNRPGRRMRHTSSHGSNVSSPRIAESQPFNSINQAVTHSSPMAARNNLFNSVNGMTLPMTIPQGVDDEDEDDVSVAAPMSPRGEALLPTDLLGDDSEDEMVPDEDEMPTRPTQPDYQTDPFPTFQPSSLRGGEQEEGDSPSPQSASSPRSFASPHEEFFPEQREGDGRSIRSFHPPIPEDAPAEPPTHKRLTSMSNLFSFNRQRGKTASGDQPPALGSLKHESQSFPRKSEDFDPSMQPRRRLSYGGNWAFPGGNFLGKQDDGEAYPPKPSFTRRAFPSLLPGLGKSASRNYDPFAPRTNSLDPGGRGGSSSPRPGSTYSFDVLPRPSAEDTFRVNWAFDRHGARNSPLAPDWASSISRSHSRRPSLGFGSQTNLSLQPDSDGEYIEPRRDTRPLQAPIGTRPTSSQQQQRPATPKLNPNAPTFTMFGFGKNREKVEKKDKDKDKDKSKLKEDGNGPSTNSPPEPRKSKDTYQSSIALTTSTMESRESLERTTSGISGSFGPSASLESTPASMSKPTFMSKITRKASSNKFDAWKTKSTSIFSSRTPRSGAGEATTPTGTGDITEDDTATSVVGSTEHLGRSVESNTSTPSGEDKKGARTSLGSWNFMRKKQKTPNARGGNGDLTASEISESSELVSESGTTTDHEDVEGVGGNGGGGSRPVTGASATAAA